MNVPVNVLLVITDKPPKPADIVDKHIMDQKYTEQKSGLYEFELSGCKLMP